MSFNWQTNGDTHYRILGRTGVRVPKLCLGTMNFGGPTPEDDSIRMIHAALDAGMSFIDTANVYVRGESERVIGKALVGGKRDQVFLATKAVIRVGDDPNDEGLSRYHLMRACEDSLRRLNTDHIDLYQLHRPDLDIALDEPLRALDDLIRQGKVRYIGVSTFPAWLTVEGIHLSERLGLNRFVTEQLPYNLLDRRIENSILPMCRRYGLGVLAWSPLAGGVLAGNYPPGESIPPGSRLDRHAVFQERITPRARRYGAQFVQVAQDYGMNPAQLATLWATEQPGITSVIIGPRTMSHLEVALSALDLTLADEIAVRLDAINPPGSAVANFFNNSRWMKMHIPAE